MFRADLNSSGGQEWLSSVKKVLKDKEFEILNTDTLEQVKIEPLYADNLKTNPIIGRKQGTPWHVVQRVDSGSVGSINQELKLAKLGGCNYFDLVLPDAPVAYSRGIQLNRIDDLEQLFTGIDITELVIRITGGLDTLPLTAAILHYADKVGTQTGNLSIEQSFDLTLSKFGCVSREEALLRMQYLSGQWNSLEEKSNCNKFLATDARIWHNAGANNVVELALCVSQFVETLRLSENNEIGPEKILENITVVLAAGVNQFANIAKFRSIRILLNSVLEHCKINPIPIPIHTESSWRMMSIHDPWVNLLRTTIACFSAGIGGADSITILPYSYVLGNNSLANRLARNTQRILLEESNLAVVSDPAAGSGIIEELTQQYCDQAWEMFQKIEQLGGLFEANKTGFIHEVIKINEKHRSEDIETAHLKLTGVNSFPNISEEPPEIEVISPPIEGELDSSFQNVSENSNDWYVKIAEKIAETGIIPANFETFEALTAERQITLSRLSQPFEELRLKAEQLTANGHKPEIFIAGLGSPAQFTKSITFAKSFFESAGIASTGNHITQSPTELIDSIKKSKSSLICLGSNKEGFDEFGSELAKALKEININKIYIVKQHSELLEYMFNFANLEFIYQGCNMITILNNALELIGQSNKK